MVAACRSPGCRAGRDTAAVQSVDRAVSALEHVARHGAAGVSDTAEAIGVHKSTASRLLGALAARGLLEPAGERGRYRLGYGILRLAGAMGGRLDVTTAGRPVCDELARLTGETVNIAVRQGLSVVNVHQSTGGQSITVDNWVGRPTPLHATSSGKVLLAFANPGHRADATPPLDRYTPDTVTETDVARASAPGRAGKRLGLHRRRVRTGLNAVAAPIFGAAGAKSGAIAALSVSGPTYRMPRQSLATLALPVVAAALRISERMGFLG